MPPGYGALAGPELAARSPSTTSDPARLSYRTAPPSLPRVRALFYGLFIAIYVSIVGSLGYFVIHWTQPVSIALFSVLAVLFVGGAYGLARQIVALVSRRGDLPLLASVENPPRVAVLYATMNDVVPECLRAIQQDVPVDVYVLDDSSDPAARAVVDEICRERRFMVIRRAHRTGFKAGAINEWYRRFGSMYRYVAVLDSDSFVPVDWVRETLRYAEHPANRRVAIFQGLINIWNHDTRFVQTLAPMSRVGQFVWEEQLANALDAVFCYGHNVLIRVAALDEIGGFVEGYVSEDFATAIALADRGWHSRFVPLHTYEAMPENVRGFIKRQNKWTRGAMEFIEFSRRSRIPVSRKFHLWQTPLGHFANLLLPVGMFLTVYGFASTPAAAVAFLTAFFHAPLATIWGITLFRFLIIVGVLASIPTVLVMHRCRIGFGTYWRQRWLSSAVTAVALPFEAISMASYLSRRLRQVPVTPKSEAPLTVREVLYLARFSLLIDGVLLLGIAFVNPVGALFNATWLVPMLAAPWIILRFSGPPVLGQGATSVPVGAWDVVARERRAGAVYDSLQQIRATGRLPPSWSAPQAG